MCPFGGRNRKVAIEEPEVSASQTDSFASATWRIVRPLTSGRSEMPTRTRDAGLDTVVMSRRERDGRDAERTSGWRYLS